MCVPPRRVIDVVDTSEANIREPDDELWDYDYYKKIHKCEPHQNSHALTWEPGKKEVLVLGISTARSQTLGYA